MDHRLVVFFNPVYLHKSVKLDQGEKVNSPKSNAVGIDESNTHCEENVRIGEEHGDDMSDSLYI